MTALSTSRPPACLLLHPDDSVAVAAHGLDPGAEVLAGSSHVVVRDPVPAGHKVALADIAEGAVVRKYGQVIGLASRLIAKGEHVHTHNLGYAQLDRDYAVGVDKTGPSLLPGDQRASFQGYVRADGRVATRNYIGVITSVNCSATVARMIARQFSEPSGLLEEYPHVDGVVALTHGSGCGMAGSGEGFDVLRRVLSGYARHPNFAGLLVLGLGCEVNQVRSLTEGFELPESTPVVSMTIQGMGGTKATVREATARVLEMAAEADKARRTLVPASELVLALECGGSDGYSGITANPSLGAAADTLVRHGGTAVLAETPEIYGAEHLLTRRAASPEVAERLLQRVRWWEAYAESCGASLDNNPSPGNKEGGLTTILEKSLGAVAKGGTSDLAAVYEYAEPVSSKGFVFMDTPGYDPVSVTGMVAGGANVVCFTTGRGSVFGSKPAPCIKLATNSDTYQRMAEDMDVNCGVVLDGTATVQEVGRQIFELVLAVASGEKTKSEDLGFGDEEFTPWQIGAVL